MTSPRGREGTPEADAVASHSGAVPGGGRGLENSDPCSAGYQLSGFVLKFLLCPLLELGGLSASLNFSFHNCKEQTVMTPSGAV